MGDRGPQTSRTVRRGTFRPLARTCLQDRCQPRAEGGEDARGQALEAEADLREIADGLVAVAESGVVAQQRLRAFGARDELVARRVAPGPEVEDRQLFG